MQLDVFTSLADDRLTAAEIARGISLPEERLSRLLNALVLTGLLVRDDVHFANSAEAREFLVKGRPAYVGGSHNLLAISGLLTCVPLNRLSLASRVPRTIFPVWTKPP